MRDLERRVARLEAVAGSVHACRVVRVVPPDVFADPGRLSSWQADQRAALPPGAELVTICTGIPERPPIHAHAGAAPWGGAPAPRDLTLPRLAPDRRH